MLSTRVWHLGTTIFVSKYCVYTGGGVGWGHGVWVDLTNVHKGPAEVRGSRVGPLG